jgi:ribosomal protein S18 acetylase RimI-like enzyme
VESQVVKVEEAGDLVATVVLAFAADPFVRWLLPDPSRYVSSFTEITRLHAERTSANGGAFALADGRGAAFWYPPGVELDREALGQVFVGADVLDRAGAVFRVVATLEPEQPYWYLRQIGVDPALQSRGLGSALLAAGLAEVDARHEMAYLEATSASSRALYERHGFTTLDEVVVDGSAPLWPMRRDPAP